MDAARADAPRPVQETSGELLRQYQLAAGLSQEELATAGESLGNAA
jgi:hypothetical protein